MESEANGKPMEEKRRGTGKRKRIDASMVS